MKKQRIATYEEAVSYLYGIPGFTAKHTLADTRAQLARLGSPDRRLGRVVHVAGTNGKGSVCAYLRSILEEAGYTVAVFTSPHLVDIRERFYIRGELVSREAFLQSFLTVYESLDWAALEAGEGYHPTYFEYLFLMAALLFAQSGVDYCILETGLGGRLDATNALSQKELALITRIGLDHVEYLGDTVAAIAGEKAGIMAQQVPLVFLDSDPEATEVFCRKAQELGVPAYPVSKKDYKFSKKHKKSIDFSAYTQYYGCIELKLSTAACYQMENAALALRAVEVLDQGRRITAAQIQNGMKRCLWEGRMEEVAPEVYVDGAHNEDGIRAFLESVRADGCEAGRSLLFGVVQDKDYRSMIRRILGSALFDRIAVAKLRSSRAADLESLRGIFDAQGQEESPGAGSDRFCAFYDSAPEALGCLLDTRREGERIYVAGSLYLVGEIKEFIGHDKF